MMGAEKAQARAMRNLMVSAVVGLLGVACVVSEGSGGSGGVGGSGAGGLGGTGGAGGEGGGCFVPTPMAGEGEFVAVDGASTQVFTFTMPDDAEGGIVTVTISGDQFFSEIRIAGSEGYLEILNGGGNPSASTQFVAAPSVSYEVEVHEGSVSGTDESQEVTVSWSLASVVDCFEPNDTVAQARPLALGETVEPFLFAGHTSNDWPSYEDHHDFFSVEVTTAGQLTIELVPPTASSEAETTIATALQVLAADETVLLDRYVLETVLEEVVEVEPGTYFIRIEPFLSPPFTESVGIGANWTKPYQLTVNGQ